MARHRSRRNRPQRTIPLPAARLRLELLEVRVVPAYVATLMGDTATFTGDAANDTLTFTESGGFLEHNRFTAGDPGFESDFDFDSTVAGVQKLAAAVASAVNIETGTGTDVVNFGDATSAASALLATFKVNNTGADGDTMTVDDSANATANTITVTDDKVTGTGINVTRTGDAFDGGVTVLAGSANDIVNVQTTAASEPVNLFTNAGDDTVVFADGATLAGGKADGGDGTDTLDYAAYTTGVAVSLGPDQLFLTKLDGAQEVPPVTTSATGTAFLLFRPEGGNNFFDIAINVQGIALDQVTASHLHDAPPGMEAPPFFDLGGPESWIDTGEELQRILAGTGGGVIPPANVPDLLAGNVYVNVHTKANPDGEIRGQLLLVAGPNSATGTGGITGFENVTGGAGDDSLVGESLEGANVLSGGGGNDLIFGRGGNDVLNGGDGDDTLVGGKGSDQMLGDAGDDVLMWNNGDGSDTMEGGTGKDTVLVTGADTDGDVFEVTANGDRLQFERTNLVPFKLDIGTTETLEVLGGLGDDTITVADLTGVADLTALQLFGLQGNDTIDASAQASAAVTTVRISGGAEDDTLTGTPQVDILLGDAGNDTLVGGKGDDQMFGGDGDDLLIWNNGDNSDLMEGGAGNDTVQVNGSPDKGDAFTVVPNADRVDFQRTNLVPFKLDIGTTETLEVNGLDGPDTFAVTPLVSTAVDIDGGPPTTRPGDVLTVDIAGTTNPVLPLAGQTAGEFTFDDRKTITFTGIESVSPVRPISQNQVTQFAVGAGTGGGTMVTVYNPDSTPAYTVDAFGGDASPGGVRVAMADVNGDGTPDLIVGTGPGRVTLVRVLDGKDKSELFQIQPFEAGFTGGVFVAAGDIDGDGFADIVITPDEGGGPRVRVFSGKTFDQLNDFFGIEDLAFRGGARAATGDLNGDGIDDLLVAAGFGGGPRIAGFNGVSVATGTTTPEKLFADIFVFENTLRNGVFIASGDINGDGFDDLIAGGGPGGGPRVFALSGADLTGDSEDQVQVANFFAGDVNNRGGIRLVAKDFDGDAFSDLVAGAGTDAQPRVTLYSGSMIPVQGTPPELDSFLAFDPAFLGGVFVG